MCATCVNDMMQSYCKGINQFSLVIVPLFGTGNWAIDVALLLSGEGEHDSRIPFTSSCTFHALPIALIHPVTALSPPFAP